jgi:hypothetical protein
MCVGCGASAGPPVSGPGARVLGGAATAAVTVCQALAGGNAQVAHLIGLAGFSDWQRDIPTVLRNLGGPARGHPEKLAFPRRGRGGRPVARDRQVAGRPPLTLPPTFPANRFAAESP